METKSIKNSQMVLKTGTNMTQMEIKFTINMVANNLPSMKNGMNTIP